MKKVIIVTGASRGIGRAIAEELSRDNIVIFKADVSNRMEVKSLVNYVLDKYGKVDVLVNNAGIAQEKLFQDITDDDWDNVIKSNLYSVFCTIQEVVPNMISNKSGCIINISSCYSVYGGPFAVAYSASKAGIDGITKSLAKELAPSHIRVNSIAPGAINTDMNAGLTSNDIEELNSEIPLGRLGEGADIARCVRWLVKDNYTTGQIISVDGGWTV